MKYTLEQWLEIRREIYTHQLNLNEEAVKYEINNFLKELNLPTLDTESLQTIKKRHEQKIKDHELPF